MSATCDLGLSVEVGPRLAAGDVRPAQDPDAGVPVELSTVRAIPRAPGGPAGPGPFRIIGQSEGAYAITLLAARHTGELRIDACAECTQYEREAAGVAEPVVTEVLPGREWSICAVEAT